MSKLIVACVRTGTRYPFTYVERLRNMVRRHLKVPHAFVCLTDRPERCEGVTFINRADLGLPGWWLKMALFEKRWREGSHVIFFDLDTVIVGDLAPLAQIAAEPRFAISKNFTRLSGNLSWPCKYASSVLTIGPGFREDVWVQFQAQRHMMEKFERYGDQRVIEELDPNATLLQDVLPEGYFCGYREITNCAPKRAAVVTFGGSNKPHNCPVPWVQKAWA